MKHFTITQCKWLFLPLFFVFVGCSDDEEKPPVGPQTNPIGLFDIYNPAKQQAFEWECPEDRSSGGQTCQYRYVVNTDSQHNFGTGSEYSSTSTSFTSTPTDDGVFYLHVQYRICNSSVPGSCNESDVFTSRFALDNTAPEVEVNSDLEDVNASNQSSYSVSGTCTAGDGDVTVRVSDGTDTATSQSVIQFQAPTCANATCGDTDCSGGLGSGPWFRCQEDHGLENDFGNGHLSANVGNCCISAEETTTTTTTSSTTLESPPTTTTTTTLEEVVGGITRVTSCVAGETEGTWSVNVDVSTLLDGTLSVSAAQTDFVGNTGSSSVRMVQKDITSPAVAIADTVGNITSDNVDSYSVSGTCASGEGDVSVSVGAITGTSPCSDTGTWEVTGLNVASLAEGNVEISATQTDSSGNEATATKTVTKNTGTTPTPVTVAITTAADISSSNAQSYSVSGTCTANSGDVSVTVGTITKTVSCSGTGTWDATGLDVSGLVNGNVVIRAVQAGASANRTVQKNTSTSNITINTAPDINASNVQTYSVSGTCTANSGTVTVNTQVSGTNTRLTRVSSCSPSGVWNVTDWDVSSLADSGSIEITVSQGVGTATESVKKDATIPNVTITRAENINANTFISYAILGTCTSGDGAVVVSFGDESNESLSCSSSGGWSFTPSNVNSLTDGSVQIVVTQTDDIGNRGRAVRSIIKDTTPPGVTINEPNPINDIRESYAVSGTCTENGRIVNLTLNAVGVTTPVQGRSTCSNGTWSVTNLDISSLTSSGNVSIVAIHTDSGGNEGRDTKTIIRSTNFITIWRIVKDADNTDDTDVTVTLPLHDNTSYGFNVNWGDIHCEADGHCTSGNENVQDITTAEAVHKYNRSGAYTVTITKTENSSGLPKWSFKDGDGNDGKSKEKLVQVVSLGNMGWTDLRGAFEGAINLTSFSGGDTSEVTDMSSMFKGAAKLATLDLSVFNTAAVTNMSSMFEGATALTSLDLSDFDTSAVTNMSAMFKNTTRLATLKGLKRVKMKGSDLFDTSRVTDMSSMFEGATALTSLDLSDFNTLIVQNMSAMFKDTLRLAELDLGIATNENPSFTTATVTDMSSMFQGASALITWNDVEFFDTRVVQDISAMFRGATRLAEIDLSTSDDPNSWDVGGITNMDSMFFGCTGLTRLDLTGWSLNGSVDSSNIFHNVPDTATFICDQDAAEDALGTIFGRDCSAE